MKYENGSSNNAGSVAYEYCLTCDSAMSRRFVYDGGSGTTQGDLLEGHRFLYDGLTLYRADQIYDDDSNGLTATDEWRVWWENTAMPALLGGHLAKRVYSYPSGTSGTSNGHTDTYYAYDAIGNVIAISDSNGARQFAFTQDAFGNELTQDRFGCDSWDTARDNGIWEHQTGKWMDPETRLYFFHHRWLDPVVGIYISRTPYPRHVEQSYVYCENVPTVRFDPDGLKSIKTEDGMGWFEEWARDWFGDGLVDLFLDEELFEQLRNNPYGDNFHTVMCDASQGVAEILIEMGCEVAISQLFSGARVIACGKNIKKWRKLERDYPTGNPNDWKKRHTAIFRAADDNCYVLSYFQHPEIPGKIELRPKKVPCPPGLD